MHETSSLIEKSKLSIFALRHCGFRIATYNDVRTVFRTEFDSWIRKMCRSPDPLHNWEDLSLSNPVGLDRCELPDDLLLKIEKCFQQVPPFLDEILRIKKFQINVDSRNENRYEFVRRGGQYTVYATVTDSSTFVLGSNPYSTTNGLYRRTIHAYTAPCRTLHHELRHHYDEAICRLYNITLRSIYEILGATDYLRKRELCQLLHNGYEAHVILGIMASDRQLNMTKCCDACLLLSMGFPPRFHHCRTPDQVPEWFVEKVSQIHGWQKQNARIVIEFIFGCN
jgi:hypothetical protein